MAVVCVCEREKESGSKQMDVAEDLEKEIKREGEAAATTLDQEASGEGREAETNAVNPSRGHGGFPSPWWLMLATSYCLSFALLPQLSSL